MTWAWHPHFDVWLLVATLAGGYWYALRRLGPRHVPAGQTTATRTQVASYALGVFTVWLSADWPVHDLAERFLYSMHMTQHMLMTLVAPPLLLLGTPGWLARLVLSPGWLYRVALRVTRPVPALLVFNGLIVITHWPAFVDFTLRAEIFHFLAHAAIFTSALVMWAPVLAPLPEIRRLSPPGQMLYLFLQSIVPTVPASFMVFTDKPIYRFYETVPRLWGLSATEDQRIGGLLMKIAGGFLLWAVIGVIFFRWHAQEEASDRQARQWRELDTELDSLKWSRK